MLVIKLSLILKIMATKTSTKGKIPTAITTTEALTTQANIPTAGQQTTLIKINRTTTTKTRNQAMQQAANTMTITSLMAILNNSSSNNQLITLHLNHLTKTTLALTTTAMATIINRIATEVGTTTHIQRRVTVATINLALIITLLLLMSSISIPLRTTH